MRTNKRRDQEVSKHLARNDADFARRYPTLARRRPLIRWQKDTRIALGAGPAGERVWLDELPRLEHMHTLGTTGTGKTTLLEQMIVNLDTDFADWSGGVETRKLRFPKFSRL